MKDQLKIYCCKKFEIIVKDEATKTFKNDTDVNFNQVIRTMYCFATNR